MLDSVLVEQLLAEEFHEAVVALEPRAVVVLEQASLVLFGRDEHGQACRLLFASLDHRRRRRRRLVSVHILSALVRTGSVTVILVSQVLLRVRIVDDHVR